MTVYVVGSGPAGISSAVALVKQGLNVRMLDAGVSLEPERLRIVQGLGSNRPGDWDKISLNAIKENMTPEIGGIPLKLLYGSDFPYREVDKYIPMEAREADSSPSLAKGGLSNVWGAGVLPYIEEDIAGWPISIADLAPHYEAVLSFMHVSALNDGLDCIHPLYTGATGSLRPSRQAVALMEDLRKNRDRLTAEGFSFEYSRLAVRSSPSGDSPGCVYCGLCMYGCPYGLIYNSSYTLANLQKAANFAYTAGVVVERIVETKGKVAIEARSMLSGEKIRFQGSRVYLACGVLSTTKILLESLEAYDRPLTMKDSQYFMFPLLRYKKVSNVTAEDLHTLCQIFLRLVDPQLMENGVHFSLYSYNDLTSRLFKKILGPAHSVLRLPINQLLGRLFIIQGYLHSNISSNITLKLARAKEGCPGSLILEGNRKAFTVGVIKRIVAKVFRNRRYFRAVPIAPLLHVAKPGRGFHSGGTFPMKNTCSSLDTDRLGRPYGFQKLHVVDATVFPTIPAGPITLSVMANAHRIASAFDET